jgi:hypothetical protein
MMEGRFCLPNGPRRTLPPLPHLEKLKKEAKARLAEMRARTPVARLADAQHLLARDYGFESWAALKSEVERRNSGPEAAALRGNKARGALFRAGRRMPDEDSDPQSPAAFFHAGMAATVGFVLLALLGVALLFVTSAEGPARFQALARFFAGRAP